MTAHLSRRTLLGAVPTLAAPMALLPAALAEASSEGPILALYRQWAPIRAAMLEGHRTDAEVPRLYPLLLALEDRIEPLPVTSLEDLAAKVSALASDEDEDTATIPHHLVAECRMLLGEKYDEGPLPVLPVAVPIQIPEEPDLSTPEGRIAAVCQWFDLEPPSLAPGEDLLESKVALDWIIASGVSIDWLVMGDPKGLVHAFRKDELQRREFLANVRQADPAEVDALTEALRLRVHHGAPLEACLEAWARVVGEIRDARGIVQGALQ